jgi:thiamine-monophosphate kinase
MTPRGQRPGEFELIERYLRPLATGQGSFGLTDDVAIMPPRPGEDLVLKVDTIAEGVHFFPEDPAGHVAAKALRVNLSDLAAKGAVPRGYLLALSLRSDWTEEWVAAFARGLAEDQKTYGITLLGGDTTRAAGGTTISVSAFGVLPMGTIVRRAGARVGDAIFVSGTVGDAALGLRVRLGEINGSPAGTEVDHLFRRYALPEPRTALAPILRRHASASIDISDGLLGDLGHICRASSVSALIEVGDVPMSVPARKIVEADSSMLRWVLTGGDDYEVLATIPSASADGFVRDAASAGVPVTRIGTVTVGTGVPLAIDRAGKPITFPEASFDHFRNG